MGYVDVRSLNCLLVGWVLFVMRDFYPLHAQTKHQMFLIYLYYIYNIFYNLLVFCCVLFFQVQHYNINKNPQKNKKKKRKVVNWIKLSMFLNFPSIQKHKTVILEQQTILCIFIYNIYSLFSITIIKDSEFVCCICGFKEIHKYVIIHWIKIYE